MKMVKRKTPLAKAAKGTAVKPKAMYGKTVKPTMMKKAGTVPKAQKGTAVKDSGNKMGKMAKGGVTKKSLPKAQPGLSTGTPFQQYMKTPGAVASDTIMKTLYPNNNWDAPKNPVAKNPKNQGILEKAYEKTYGINWTSESGQPHNDETFEQYKRRMGPMKKGGITKAQKGKTVKPKAMYGKSVKPGMMKKGGTKKK